MDSYSAEKLRLELLTESQQRLMMAKNGQWELLQSSAQPWQQRLDAAFEQHAQDLQVIVTQLHEDNETLMSLVAEQQQKISQEHRKFQKNLSQTKQYLK